MTMMVVQEYNRQIKAGLRPKIFANYWMAIPHTYVTGKELAQSIEDKDTGKFEDSIIALDEIHTLFDSRNSSSQKNRILSYFITQTAKAGCMLFWSAQVWGTADTRLRNNTSIRYKTKRVVYNPFTGRFSEVLMSDRRTDFLINVEREELTDTSRGAFFIASHRFTITDPKRFFHLFNTKQRIFLEDDVIENIKNKRLMNEARFKRIKNRYLEDG